jgi:hypothetical protein
MGSTKESINKINFAPHKKLLVPPIGIKKLCPLIKNFKN